MYFARPWRASGIQNTGVRNIRNCIAEATIGAMSRYRAVRMPRMIEIAWRLTSTSSKPGTNTSCRDDSPTPAQIATGT